MNTLTYGSTTLVLPVDLIWVDEFAWRPVLQQESYSLTGALQLEVGVRQAGRPITLQGEAQAAWISRADLLTLQAWAALPGQTFGLVVRSEASRTVYMDNAAGAVSAEPVIAYRTVDAADRYRNLVLRFKQT